MKKVSRIKKSRDRWKEKATARASEIRERRKSEKRLKTRIQELKAELKRLKNSSESEKPSPTSTKNSELIELGEASDTRALSVLIILSTMISFRAVQSIFNILSVDGWIPHFTSVVNWTLRVGLALLNRARVVAYPWIAIIDYSLAILKDKGTDLSRGVSLWKENNYKRNIPTIDDVSHVVANALKKQFEDTEPFRKFKEMINVAIKKSGFKRRDLSVNQRFIE